MSDKTIQKVEKEEKLSFPLVLKKPELELIRKHIAPDATAGEFALFIYDAQSRGLNPLKKQIYFVKYGGKPSHQVAIDGYRALAVRSGQYDGITKVTYGDTVHSKYDRDLEVPEWAEVSVYRKGCTQPFTVQIYFDEFVQVFNGKVSTQWKQRPHHMLGKCAEALALRKGFPEQLSGVYSTVEMGGTEDEPMDPNQEATVVEKETVAAPVQKSFDEETDSNTAPVTPKF